MLDFPLFSDKMTYDNDAYRKTSEIMNTYKDDPTKGLSKMQKAILSYLCRPSRFAKPDEPAPIGADWTERPTFAYYRRMHGYEFPSLPRANSAAVSRALRNLERRGLVRRLYVEKYPRLRPDHTNYVELTELGKEYVKRLS